MIPVTAVKIALVPVTIEPVTTLKIDVVPVIVVPVNKVINPDAPLKDPVNVPDADPVKVPDKFPDVDNG